MGHRRAVCYSYKATGDAVKRERTSTLLQGRQRRQWQTQKASTCKYIRWLMVAQWDIIRLGLGALGPGASAFRVTPPPVVRYNSSFLQLSISLPLPLLLSLSLSVFLSLSLSYAHTFNFSCYSFYTLTHTYARDPPSIPIYPLSFLGACARRCVVRDLNLNFLPGCRRVRDIPVGISLLCNV